MAISRTVWKGEFTSTSKILWPCPSCGAGTLRLKKDTLASGETRDSKQAHEHEAWDPEWIDGRFSCMMECPNCDNQVSVAGRYRVQDDRYWDERSGDSGDYDLYYKPEFFSESPQPIAIADNTPQEVVSELENAFRLYWVDPFAAANRIRASIEALLTAQRIPRTAGRSPGRGKRVFLPLHDRIVRFSKKQPDIGDQLMAVKWLGNAGSHSAAITPDDVLDGFEIMEYALDKLYSDREKRVKAISRAINRRKAPRSPRRAQ